MDFISKLLSKYVDEHSEDEPEILAELSRETHVKILNPRMLAGHFQGRLLSFLSKLIRPQRILEVGTYTGYSAICFSEGLANEGEIISIDHNEELEWIQTKYFKKLGISDVVTRKVGEAKDIIPTLEGSFDLVFLDADKENYCTYFDQVFNKVPVGGFIIADNVLWSGKVLDKAQEDDVDTLGLQAYNKRVKDDARVEALLLPIRDGISICRKISD